MDSNSSQLKWEKVPRATTCDGRLLNLYLSVMVGDSTMVVIGFLKRGLEVKDDHK